MATFQGQPIINNVAYSWSMIELTLNIGGTEDKTMFLDCTSISWSSERKMDSIYGLGGQPRKRGFGNVTYEASITLPYGTQMELREYSPDGTLLGLGEFNLVVSWINDLAANAASETVTLAGCLFTQGGMDANQDDTSLTKEFNLHPHRIYTNKTAGLTGTAWTHELYNG